MKKNISHSRLRDQTLAVRSGNCQTSFNEHSAPLFLTSSFVFENAESARALFANERDGYVYSRFSNPTIDALSEKMVHLEGGDYGLMTASGMSAIMTLCLALLKSGDKVVVAMDVFGATWGLFKDVMPRFGLEVEFVQLTDRDAWQAAVDEKTVFLFCETPSNPLMDVVDIRWLSELAHSVGALLIVDNCIATPALQKPLDHGADVVVHSLTKFIDGGGRCLGGAIVTKQEALYRQMYQILRTTGPSLSPFNAWVLLKSLETLHIRMAEHCRNADQVAQWLSEQSNVKKVYHPSLADPQEKMRFKQQMKAYGSIVSFEVFGERDVAWQVINHCQLFSITANMGDSRSTICHPATTTHCRLDEAARQSIGISEGLIRLSIGLEHPEDLCDDLSLALNVSP